MRTLYTLRKNICTKEIILVNDNLQKIWEENQGSSKKIKESGDVQKSGEIKELGEKMERGTDMGEFYCSNALTEINEPFVWNNYFGWRRTGGSAYMSKDDLHHYIVKSTQ